MDRNKWEKMLIHFQAFARGYFVRSEVRRAREDFEDVVQEIDGSLSHLQWRDTVISIPHFTDTQGTHLRPSTFTISPSDPGLNVSGSPQRPSTPAATCLSQESQVLLEKMEAERDEPQTKGQDSVLDCLCHSHVDRDEYGQMPKSVSEQQADNNCEMMESTGDATSVWSSMDLEMSYGHSHKGSLQYHLPQEVPQSPEALHLHRNELTMELVWIQQAIDSRKKYLLLKDRLNIS